ncbi:MAG: hypothetical protein DRR19_31920, partial [Candidatus Parabeggiatoa sp. nov. 1]
MFWKAKTRLYLQGLIAVGLLSLLIFILGLGLLPNTQLGYKINTIAGSGMPEYAGDGGDAKAAKIKHPRGLAVDKAGNLYIADAENHRVRKVDIGTGIITTIAGGGSQTVPCNQDAKPIKATDAFLYEPISVVVDEVNNLYILVTACVYKVTQNLIMPFIGSDKPGYNGDGNALGTPINAQYGDISLDPQNEFLYIADRENHCIRMVNLNDKPHQMTTVAGICGKLGYDHEGKATEVRLYLPEDVVLDKEGNMYIADTANLVIRYVYVDKKTNRLTTTTIAGKNGIKKHGGDNGPAIEATFAHPIDLVIDNSGELYIVDQESHRIRHIDHDKKIRTIAGNGEQTYRGDGGGDATEASLNHPKDIALISDSKEGSFIGLYVSDKRNHRIRKLERIQEPPPLLPWWLIILGLVLLLGIGIAIYYLRLYRHPIVQALSADTSRLLTTPLEQLAQTKRLLQRTHRLDTVLVNNEVPVEWLDNAIHFATMSNAQRTALLAQRLIATEKATENADIFMLKLGEAFPLNLSRCLLYFPPTDLPTQDVVLQLQQDEMVFQNVLVISLEASQQNALRPHGENLTTQWIVPNSRELTELLLSPEPTQVFVRLLANQLKVTNLSPYQTRGGVTKDSSFFGREKILAQILNREPMNYLIIGGRQLGKSSLLRRIERHYQNHPKVDCFYLSLRKDNLQQVKLTFGLAKDAPLLT